MSDLELKTGHRVTFGFEFLGKPPGTVFRVTEDLSWNDIKCAQLAEDLETEETLP